MSYGANETHTYESRPAARAAIEAATNPTIDLDDVFVYQADGKWGWIRFEETVEPTSADAHIVEDQASEDDCEECGEPPFITDDVVSHHGQPGEVDHESDGDHVALVPEVDPEPEADPTETPAADEEQEPEATSNVVDMADRMVTVQIARYLPLKGSGPRALAMAALARQPVTITIAETGAVLATIEPPVRPWVFVDGKGREHVPTEAQALFIAMCLNENGATSAELKAAIQGEDDKVAKNWMQFGEAVEKFGFNFDFEHRKTSRFKSERLFLLTQVDDVAEAAD